MNQSIEITVMVLTNLMESGGEDYIGKLAQAYVMRNSMRYWGRSLTDEVFKQNRYSCWLPGSMTLQNLDEHANGTIVESLRACVAAMWQQEPDPTHGAVFYLNEAQVIKDAGKLPGWWTIDGDPNSETKYGKHTFRRHRLQKV